MRMGAAPDRADSNVFQGRHSGCKCRETIYSVGVSLYRSFLCGELKVTRPSVWRILDFAAIIVVIGLLIYCGRDWWRRQPMRVHGDLIGRSDDYAVTKLGMPTRSAKFTALDVMPEDRIEIRNYVRAGAVRSDEEILEHIWQTERSRVVAWYQWTIAGWKCFWTRSFRAEAVS